MDLQAAIRIPALCCKCLLARAAGAEVGDDDTGLGDGTDRFHRGGMLQTLIPVGLGPSIFDPEIKP